MIKINLLPHKKVKAIEKGVLKLRMVAAGITAVVFLVLAYMSFALYSERRELNHKLDRTVKQLDELKKKVSQVENYEKARKEFEQKLGIIQSLAKRRVSMTLLLGELNAMTTKDVWFTTLSVSGDSFTLEGVARDNRKNIETFVSKLKSSKALSAITVQDIKEDFSPGIDKFTFKLTGNVLNYDQGAALMAAEAPPAQAPKAAQQPVAPAPPAKTVPPPAKAVPPPAKAVPPPAKAVPPPAKAVPPPAKAVPPPQKKAGAQNTTGR